MSLVSLKLDVYKKIMIWKCGDKCINTKQSRELRILWQPFMEQHNKAQCHFFKNET